MLFSFISTSSDSKVMEDFLEGCMDAKRKRKVSFESEHLWQWPLLPKLSDNATILLKVYSRLYKS